MRLELTYPELSLLRDLVQKHRFEILMGLMKLNVKIKNKPMSEISEMTRKFNEDRNPHCPQGLCGTVLDKIEAIEDELQAEMGKGRNGKLVKTKQ